MIESRPPAAVAQAVARLTPGRAALAASLLRQRGGAGVSRAAEPPGTPGVAAAGLLSAVQRRLWFLQHLDPVNTTYALACAFDVIGPLTAPVLAACARGILQRHAVLRTVFPVEHGRPVQRPLHAGSVPAARVDLRGLAAADRLRAVHALTAIESRTPFDLERQPPIRLTFVLRDEGEHAIIVAVHHIASDAGSVSLFVDELGRSCDAAIQRQSDAVLPPLPFQYADVAAAEQEALDSDALEPRLSYWKARLADAPALNLPFDRPRTASTRGRSASVGLALPGLAALRQLAREESVSFFAVLLSLFHVFLGKCSGSDDIPVGTPVSSRVRGGTERLIGPFVNTLVFRGDLSGRPSLRELVRRTNVVVRSGYAHGDVPFERVVEELHPARAVHQQPLFQVLFDFQQRPRRAYASAHCRVVPVRFRPGGTPFDLELRVVEDGDAAAARMVFNAALFEPATVQRLAGYWGALLQAASAAPDRAVSSLPILSGAERDRLVHDWNPPRAAAAEQTDLPLDRVFEQRAHHQPDAIAVVSGEAHLTYRALDRRANQLAHAVRRRLPSVGSRVGLCVERSLELVVGVIGILRAGCTYVPLDPDYPDARLTAIADHAAIPLVVTTPHLRRAVSTTRPALMLDPDAPHWTNEPATAPEPLTTGALPAYVIYTSGSTGVPKGVVVPHRNVRRLFEGTDRAFGFGREDVWTLFHSNAFDLAVWELWGALAYGGRLVIVPYWVSRTPDTCAALLRREQVTVLTQTPTAFRQLMPVAGAGALRWIVFAGEALDFKSLEGWFSAHGDERPRLVNMYGITETTIHVTYREVARGDTGLQSRIGLAVPGWQGYVLDRHLELAPTGVVGELCVGGDGLAHGYLDEPRLTAVRFVPDPFGDAGQRLYRSGDLAWYAAPADLAYAGRRDTQVKVRGFRIELREIEAVLSDDPAVAHAAVLVRGDDPATPRLVAYVVPKPHCVVDVAALRAGVQARLPPHMVPSGWVTMDRLPLTVNGKLDRAALPPPQPDGASSGRMPARTETESALMSIWADVLRLERIGVHDNFFELGGDSIVSIQIVSRAREAGLELTVRDIFERQTVAELAGIVRMVATEHRTLAPPGAPWPLTPIQRWFFDWQTDRPNLYVQAADMAIRTVAPAAILAAAEAVVRQHAGLRSRFHRVGTEWRQAASNVSRGALVSHVDLSGLSRATRLRETARCRGHLERSLDIVEGPVVRIALFDHGAERVSRLVMAAHHLVVDAVSWRVILEDLAGAYRDRIAGRKVGPRPATASFGEWSTALQAHLGGASLHAEEKYWLAAAARSGPPLPVDLPGGNDVASAAHVAVTFTREQTLRLLDRVPAVYRTQVNDVLLTAVAWAFREWTGDEELLLHLEGHGREHMPGVDVSRTVGWFTTLFPVRLHLSGTAERAAALKTVKEQLRGVPSRGLGYGVLRHLASGDVQQALAASAEPQVSFNYLGNLDRAVPRDGWVALSKPAVRLIQPGSAPRRHLIDITARILDGSLRVHWTYGRQVHRPATIRRLARSFARSLRALIDHCTDAETGGCTPSDFPLVRIDQDELDRLVEGQPGQIANIYPLSPLQHGLVFHTMVGRPDACVEQVTCTLHGPLNVPHFRGAWRGAVQGNAVLRTGVVWRSSGVPVQLVMRSADVPWDVQDWRALPAGEQMEAVERNRAELRQRGWDLGAPPLMRMALWRTGEEEYQFTWLYHHLLLDGWSNALVVDEVLRAYDGLCRGSIADRPQRRPYADYVGWLQSRDVQETESHWRRLLHDHRRPTALGIGRAPSVFSPQTLTYGEERHALTEPVTAALGSVARARHLTLNTLVQAAWALTLSRYSGDPAVCFGVTVAGRPPELAGVESMVGLFINTVPVRIAVPPAASFATWLGDIQRQQAEHRQYEFTPLTDVRRWTGTPNGEPLFESVLVFENYPVDPASRGTADVRISNLRVRPSTSYPLTLVVAPGPTLRLRCLYEQRRFDAAAVGSMLRDVEHVLAWMASRTDGEIGACTLPSAADATAGGATHDRPGTVEPLLAAIWTDLFHVTHASPGDNFFDLGGDSLLAARLIARIRSACGVELSMRSVFEAACFADLAARIDTARSGPRA